MSDDLSRKSTGGFAKAPATIRYFGWSALQVATAQGTLLFDPFYRRYCGVQWFGEDDFAHADFIAVTHGHEEHFLDVPSIARRTGARVIGPSSVTGFLRRRRGIPDAKLIPLDAGSRVELPGFTVESFGWQHRDINLVKALSKAVFLGRTTQIKWAWHSATQAPFLAPYTGYRLTLPDGTTVMNYNEGFNSKMTDGEIRALAAQRPTDVLLGGIQLDFTADLARGVAALRPRLVLLYPPHEKFHAMMGASSRPDEEFVAAAQSAAPQARIVVLRPGAEVDLATGAVSRFSPKAAPSPVRAA